MENGHLLTYKDLKVTKVSVDFDLLGGKRELPWSIAGMMRLKEDGVLEVGIQAHCEKIALFEMKGIFEPSGFDPDNQEQVTDIRTWSFAFLFPYLRSLIDQTFAAARHPMRPFPIIDVYSVFGKVPLTKE